MSVSGHQVAEHYRSQAQTLRELIEAHRKLRETMAVRDEDLAAQVRHARRELASVYLTDLGDASLERVAKLTGFQGFARRDPRIALEHERKVLGARLATLEADDRYQRRDVLGGAEGTLTQELQQNQETLAPLQAACDRFEQLPELATLVAIGYDTPRFEEKWWQASYWKHWAAGDRVCKELGMNDFGDDVLPAYQEVAEPRNVMRAEVERLEREIDALHGLVREHDELADRLAHLDEIFLGEAQDFLGEHLANADAALLEDWAKAEPDLVRAVQIGVRKLAGLQAKRSILSDIAQTGIPQTIAQLEQRQTKARRKIEKFSRPKHAYARWPDTIIDRGFDQKSRNIQGQIDKLNKRVDHLLGSHNYAGFDLRNDPYLWWWYFTESAPPRYAPHYFDYYQRHPQFHVETDPEFAGDVHDGGEDVARAFAAADLEQGGYLS